MPGRTRFFKIEVEVADPDINSTREDSNALCPVAAHRLVRKCQLDLICVALLN
jgi:hypothetical protein